MKEKIKKDKNYKKKEFAKFDFVIIELKKNLN